MKHALILIGILVWSVPAIAQGAASRAEMVQQFCRARELSSGTAVERVKAIEARLESVLRTRQVPGPRILVVVVESDVINAFDYNPSPRESLICIPDAMVRFMGDSEGEMAFILAHETGHALDSACKSDEGRTTVALPSLFGAINRLLGGTGRDPLAEQRTCESRADAIGFALLVAAGYSPYDAAGAFGRLEMCEGDTSTSVLARFKALGSTHPITPDRIAHMRSLLSEFPGSNIGEADMSVLGGYQAPLQVPDESPSQETNEDAKYIATLLQQANRGEAASQYILGLRFESGNGVDRDEKQARYWYGKAAENGLGAAKDALKRLSGPILNTP